MSKKIYILEQHEMEPFYAFHCPGCKCEHGIPVTGPRAWGWNGSVEAPSFTPSIKVTGATSVCHSYVTDGKIQYLEDCTHDLKSQTVELPEIEA